MRMRRSSGRWGRVERKLSALVCQQLLGLPVPTHSCAAGWGCQQRATGGGRGVAWGAAATPAAPLACRCSRPLSRPRLPACSRLQAGGAARPAEVDNDCGVPSGPHRQAVPGAVSAACSLALAAAAGCWHWLRPTAAARPRRPPPMPCLSLDAAARQLLGPRNATSRGRRPPPLRSISSALSTRPRSWHNHLNPAIKRGQWTRHEDEVIVRFHRRFGNQVRALDCGGGGSAQSGLGCLRRGLGGCLPASLLASARLLRLGHAPGGGNPTRLRALTHAHAFTGLCPFAVGPHGAAPQGSHRQRHQEPLELHAAAQGGT